jgi:hypothetical protein
LPGFGEKWNCCGMRHPIRQQLDRYLTSNPWP